MNPERKRLPHEPPFWLDPGGETWFVTLCCQERGRNQLAEKGAWQTLLGGVLKYRELGYWYPRLFLAMPDHVHVLLGFPDSFFLKKRVATFKSWTSRQAGISWQRDFFDHRLRSAEEGVAKRNYIEMNPVRAGLCKEPRDWPYVWSVNEATDA